jgi:hypothetical protein
MYNGLLPMQKTVNDFIMKITSAADKGFYVSEAGVAFVPFPSLSYEKNGFFAETGSKCIEAILLPFVIHVFALTLLLPLYRFCPSVDCTWLTVSSIRHDRLHSKRKAVATERIDENDERYRIGYRLVLVLSVLWFTYHYSYLSCSCLHFFI